MLDKLLPNVHMYKMVWQQDKKLFLKVLI